MEGHTSVHQKGVQRAAINKSIVEVGADLSALMRRELLPCQHERQAKSDVDVWRCTPSLLGQRFTRSSETTRSCQRKMGNSTRSWFLILPYLLQLRCWVLPQQNLDL